MYLKPTALVDGDKVAIITPSSPITSTKAIQSALPVFVECGLEPVLGPNLRNLRSDAWNSAPVDQRIHEIDWAFSDNTISAVCVSEGGYSAIELLPYIPYDLIRKTRKPFMGMSDITVINNAILRCSGLVNFCGPNIRIREKKPLDEQNLKHALMLLKLDSEWHNDPFSDCSLPRCVCGGIVRGTSIGGNLTLFTALIGTPFLPELEGAILFLEDTQAGGYEVSACLNQLELAGVFEKVGGVVFGEFVERPERQDSDVSVEDVVVRFFEDKLPCVFGMNFSHGETVANVPLGVETSLDAESCMVMFGNPFS